MSFYAGQASVWLHIRPTPNAVRCACAAVPGENQNLNLACESRCEWPRPACSKATLDLQFQKSIQLSGLVTPGIRGPQDEGPTALSWLQQGPSLPPARHPSLLLLLRGLRSYPQPTVQSTTVRCPRPRPPLTLDQLAHTPMSLHSHPPPSIHMLLHGLKGLWPPPPLLNIFFPFPPSPALLLFSLLSTVFRCQSSDTLHSFTQTGAHYRVSHSFFSATKSCSHNLENQHSRN